MWKAFQVLHYQIRMELLEKWHNQLGRIHPIGLHGDQHHRNHDAGCDLQPQLCPPRQPQVPAVHHFCVIVSKSNRRKRARSENRDPYEPVAQVRPQQRRHHDGYGDQQPPHRRSPGFFLMSFRTFFPNVLSNLELAQPVDHQRSHDKRGKQCGKTGKRGAERQVAEDAEWRKIMLQLHEQQPVEQSASVPRRFQCFPSRRAFHVSSAFSSLTPREAFNKITSPPRASRASHSPASSGPATNSAWVPACPALSTIACDSPRTPSNTSIFFSAICSPACRCISSPAGPNSSISPATPMSRVAALVASASTIASRAFGFEL